MGALYLAQDPVIDRHVAIKVLITGLDNEDMRDRFSREARSAGRLRHPNIVTIFDVGEHGGRPFIAMEYIDGSTLDDIIQRREPLPLERKIELMDALLAGLQFAHRNGVIHRDIKPANVMIDAEGTLKILDFGIARLGGAGRTQSGAVMGTLNYMAPEQLMSEAIDGRTDLYSFGAVFYELLSYRRACPGEMPAILREIVSGKPEPLEQIVPTLDPAVIAFVNRCLQKAPDARYPDVAAARLDLAKVQARLLRRDAPPPAPDPNAQPAHTPRPHHNAIHKIRAEQIESHLAEARRSVESGSYQTALEACHRALVIDPNCEPAIAIEEQARGALEAQQLETWLAEARSELDRGSLTAASVLVERALSLNSSLPGAIALRQAIDEARRKIAEEQKRTQRLEQAVAHARALLEAGDLAAAGASADDALGLEAAHAGALAVKRDVDRAIEVRREAAAAAAARRVVGEAQQLFAKGDHAAAIALLERAASHALVTAALTELRIELEAIERIRKETARKVEEASRRLKKHDLDGALALVNEVLGREPGRDDARKLKAQIDTALDRQRQIAAGLSSAQDHLTGKRFQAAVGALDAVARLDASAVGLTELRRAAEAGLAAEAAADVRRQFDAYVAEARKALESADWSRARERVQLALRINPTDQAAMGLKVQIEDALAAARAKAAPTKEQTVRLAPPAPVTAEPTIVLAPSKPPDAPKDGQTVVLSPGGAQAPPVRGTIGRGQTVIMPRPVMDPPMPSPVPVPVPVPAPRPRLPVPPMALAAGAGVLVLLLLVWGLWPSGGGGEVIPGPVTTSPVVINIAPWATIESLTDRRDGRTVELPDSTTPLVLALPPGDYHLRAVNPNFPRPLELDFTVRPGDGVQEVQQAMPDFQADQEIENILSGR